MLFNLIVRANETQPMLPSRMFEGTPEQLTSAYRLAPVLTLMLLLSFLLL